MSEYQNPAPRRYGLDGNGEPQRLWGGKTADQFDLKDTLLFAVDTDLALAGHVSAETLAAIKDAGYKFENGALSPLEMEDATMEQNKALDVSVKIYPQTDTGKLLAYASVTLGGCFAVNNLRVMNGEKGKFVAMPATKGTDGKYHDNCCPTTPEMRKAIDSAVLGEYSRAVEKPSIKEGIKAAANEAKAQPAPSAPKQDKGER